MIKHFTQQLEKASPLTQQKIDELNTSRETRNLPPVTYEIGDVLLYGLVEQADPVPTPGFDMSVNLKMKSFTLRGTTLLGADNLIFQRATDTGFPVFTRKSTQHKEF